MPAVPVVVTISTTVSSVLAISMLTGTTASPPSVTVTSPIVTVGTSLSSMVTVPLGSVFAVLPLVTVPSTVKVSSTSSIVSSVVGIVTFTLVLPAGIVTVVVVSV